MTNVSDDVRRARGLIQGAYSKLIGRFGSESAVIEDLVEALGLLKGLTDEDIKPKRKAKAEAPSTAEPEKASEPEPGEAQPVEPAPPEPKRRATRRTTRK